MQLTEEALRVGARDTVFARGEDDVAYVHGLVRSGSTARGSVQARRVRLVELDWSGDELEGTCTCPYAADGHFCRHMVALGLAAIDEDMGDVVPVDEQLEMLDAPALRELVRELAARDPAVARLVAVRASSGRPGADMADALFAAVDGALDPRGFVNYR